MEGNAGKEGRDGRECCRGMTYREGNAVNEGLEWKEML